MVRSNSMKLWKFRKLDRAGSERQTGQSQPQSNMITAMPNKMEIPKCPETSLGSEPVKPVPGKTQGKTKMEDRADQSRTQSPKSK